MAELCNICPRRCDADRRHSLGFCGADEKTRITRAAPHFWEEPCISGTRGSGTVFFAGCNLRCIFCQNAAISRGGVGRAVSTEELARVFLDLQGQGVHNINLVTPSHYTYKIIEAVKAARSMGLSIPIVWNSGGYDSVEATRCLRGVVDIYMPDFKYVSGAIAKKYSGAADYFEVARAALDEMVLQCGGPVFDGDIMTRGVIVRHLVLPGCVEDSKAVLRFLHRRYGAAIYISIMRQYTPMGADLPDELFRKLGEEEYGAVARYAHRLGIEQGFYQEGDSIGESFIPRFDLT